MIYLDNGATGGFKPYSVINEVENTLKFLCANPGRSGHKLSLLSAEKVYDCRKTVADFLDASPDRVIFTKNCTEALNIAILGTVKKGWHVITTTFEHNSVLRPLFELKRKGIIELDVVSPENGVPLYKSVTERITDKTRLLVHTLASNVTGETFELSPVAEACSKRGIILLGDGAQSGGHIKTGIIKNGLSAIALAGHKGLFAPMGTGILAFSENVEISPVFLGGTGTETFNLSYPENYPERLESGTLNLPGIAGLNEGIKYASANMDFFSGVLKDYTEYIIENLKTFPSVNVYSKPNVIGIVSFSVGNKDSMEVSDVLSERFDIAVRGGFHCAPLTHKFYKTDKNGLIRVSLSPYNSSQEINYFLRSLKMIING